MSRYKRLSGGRSRQEVAFSPAPVGAMMTLYSLLIPVLVMANCRLRCGQHISQQLPKFYFAGACTRSRMNQITATFTKTLNECKEIAIKKKGFAINYAHSDFVHRYERQGTEDNCLVYDCPELDIQLSLHVGAIYDYYSLYARPMTEANVSCLPQIGLFQIHYHARNFSEAEKICAEENGYLADVTTGLRSSGLGSLLMKSGADRAYIGLAYDDGLMMTTSGWPLNCLTYRGWAPGEPRPKNKCGTLTHRGFWATASCQQRLPFICELHPSGPLKACQDLRNKREKRKCNKILLRSYPSRRRRPRCGDPRIDDTTFRYIPVRNISSPSVLKNITEEEIDTSINNITINN